MNDQERLTELQRQIATAKGYTDLRLGHGVYSGVLYADEGHTIVPRWPWDIDAAWRLVEEMKQLPVYNGYDLYVFAPDGTVNRDTTRCRIDFYWSGVGEASGAGKTEQEAICACWLAWHPTQQP